MEEKKEKIWGFVYLYIISNKGYVGRTVNLKKRHAEHMKKRKMKSNPYFHRSLQKYFQPGNLSILETFRDNPKNLSIILNEKEKFWIDKLNTHDPKQRKGWNLTKGGEGSIDYQHTEKTKKKMSQNHADFSGLKNPWYGKGHLQLGENNPNYRNHKLTGENNPNYGKKWSEKQKKIQRDKLKGRFCGGENPNAKKVILISPQGTNYLLLSYHLFCKKNGLNPGSISGVLHGKKEHHKGWRGRILQNEK